MNETRTQAEQDAIDEMKKNGKIIAVQLTKLAAVVTVGFILYKKIKADLKPEPVITETPED